MFTLNYLFFFLVFFNNSVLLKFFFFFVLFLIFFFFEFLMFTLYDLFFFLDFFNNSVLLKVIVSVVQINSKKSIKLIKFCSAMAYLCSLNILIKMFNNTMTSVDAS